MRRAEPRSSLLALVVLAVAGLAAAWSPGGTAGAEVARVQKHILAAEQAIATHTPDGLTPLQRRARALNLARLAAYRSRGEFPHNTDFPGRRVPYFRDQRGVLCAMAHLIAASGRMDLVDLVARTRNNATVTELAADPKLGPALAAWLVEAGMTVVEAQRVQPDYGPPEGTVDNTELDHFRRNSALLSAVSLTTILMNSEVVGPKPSPGWSGALGFFAGGFQITLGAQKVSKDSVVGALDLFIGGAAILTSLAALSHAAPSAPSSARMPGDGPGVAPLFAVSARMEPEAGVTLSF
jgi:hypothetical protein